MHSGAPGGDQADYGITFAVTVADDQVSGLDFWRTCHPPRLWHPGCDSLVMIPPLQVNCPPATAMRQMGASLFHFAVLRHFEAGQESYRVVSLDELEFRFGEGIQAVEGLGGF